MLDYFGKDIQNLKEKKIFFFDLDGTTYNENTLFEGAKELFEYLANHGRKVVFLTNNSSRSVTEYVDKLNRMGVVCDRDNFFTSTQATVMYLKEQGLTKGIYAQGTTAFVKELKESGLSLEFEDENQVQAIVVAFDTELTFEKMRRTSYLLGKNVPYIATNPDLVCPVSFGFVPDCGSMCIGYENATKRKPLYIGKPNRIMMDYALKRFGFEREEAVMVGDRLYTDIASGINAQMDTICVLSGESSIDDVKASPYKATYVLNSIKDIYDFFLSLSLEK